MPGAFRGERTLETITEFEPIFLGQVVGVLHGFLIKGGDTKAEFPVVSLALPSLSKAATCLPDSQEFGINRRSLIRCGHPFSVHGGSLNKVINPEREGLMGIYWIGGDSFPEGVPVSEAGDPSFNIVVAIFYGDLYEVMI